ncbi:transcriptional repressor LexA [Myxococcota bacterium]|nr:transcriptional repressor LexA [Myxococcota bacterium]
MAANLTDRQLQILQAVYRFAQRRGIMPSVRQLAGDVGLSAPTVQQHLVALRRKGYLEIDGSPHGVRFTRIAREALESSTVDLADVVPVPVLGRIAAGRPLEALESPVDPLPVPAAMAQVGDFLLRVQGLSMVDDGILDGDFVLIRPQRDIDDGQIAVAVLPGGEATLKRVYRDGHRVRLQPANADMKPLFADEVEVRGRLVGLLRRY